MDMLDGETEVRDYNLERLMMLSDGVFAIALTLLALELRPPEHWNGHLDTLMEGMAGGFFAFFWSFGSISILWASHRQSFGRFRRADFMLTFWNILFLGLITLVPPATRITTEGGYGLGTVLLYIALFQTIGVVNALMWMHAAFFSDIMKPGSSVRLRVVVTLILLFVAPTMTALGVLTSQPSLRWSVFLIPVVGAISVIGRRWAARTSAPPP